ncbi:MAG TPA: MmcQ/YjbR family DNA-binding protein [Lachnospiraceae bacterium]|nr:MmcQ/YjbR family DNA-binding protein [Lachnospiraceae bacterium]
MNSDLILQYCMEKQGTYLDYPFGDIPVCVKVCGKIFAELYPNPDNYKITLKCEPMLADFYRQQYEGIVVRGYHCPPVQQPYNNTIYIDLIDEGVLLNMIDHSYERAILNLSKKIRNSLIGNIDRKALIAKGAIVLDNIEIGFENYKHEILEGTSEQLLDWIKELRDKNGLEDSYVDLYYGSLLPEEQERVRSNLSEEGLRILNRYAPWREVLILPLDDELLRLTEELNTKEALFSTYYFCKYPCSVWGNYERKYPRFWN